MLSRDDLLTMCDRLSGEAAALRVLLSDAPLLPVQAADAALTLAKLAARVERLKADVAGHRPKKS